MISSEKDIAESIEVQVKRLESKVKLLNEFRSLKNFKPNDLEPFSFLVNRPMEEPDWTEFEAKFSGSNQFVYVIRTEETDSSKLYDNYNQFKDKFKDDFRLSSSNEDIRTKEFDSVLYVGTSSRGMSSFKGRLREHLGIVGPKVYSLQLRYWFKPVPAKIHVEVFPIEDEMEGVLYDFENALWDFYQPLFGKKGVNVVSSANI